MNNYYAISSDKITQIENLHKKIEAEHVIKRHLKEDEFIEYLQIVLYQIDEEINSIYDYVESTELSHRRFEKLKRETGKLIAKELELDNVLISLNSSRNRELHDFYSDVAYKLKDTSLPVQPNYRQFEELKTFIQETRDSKDYKAKSVKDRTWFKVGVLFATGEMDQLITKYNRNATRIANHLKAPHYNKYILGTMNDYRDNNLDKNVYANPEKMQMIMNHCKEQNIEVDQNFIARLKT